MSIINANPLLAAAGGDYQISRSVRLRSSASAYFNRTPAGAGTSNKTFTYSAWVKRGALGSIQNLISSPNTGNSDSLRFSAADALEYNWQDTAVGQVTTTQVFRDPSAWYHIMFAMDTTQATASNRFKLYVNGVQVTAFATASYPAQNTTVNNTAAVATKLGQYANSSAQSFDGYLTEINLIDGQALTPSSFGETDTITGVWKPKRYTGTYGTNGFYLNFSDNSAATAAAIGKDYSGNGNNWTPNNISVTAGVTYDSMLDVPTMWADGGNGRGNYAVLNPIQQYVSGGASIISATVSDGNLKATGIAASNRYTGATIIPNSGKYYCEWTIGATQTTNYLGFITIDGTLNYTIYYANGTVLKNTASAGTGATYTAGDVIGVAWDVDNGAVTFYKNGVSQSALTGVTDLARSIVSVFQTTNTDNATANFGQRPFTYTPPSGFKALNTFNLPDSTIKAGNKWFDATVYTGNGSTLAVTNSGSFQPDMVWLKNRANAYSHGIYDVLRGTGNTKGLSSDTTNGEGGFPLNQNLVSFDASGFTVGPTSSTNVLNASGQSHVGWQWKESASAGFDIVTFTNPSSGSSSFAHNLGVKPSMIIVKSRSNTSNWTTMHKSLGTNMADNWINLESTAAKQTSTNIWGGEPTSSVFFCGTGIQVAGATMVAYLFAEVAGFSKFGSYTGNGSTDGPFVYCGFRPRFVMAKRTDAADGWYMLDTSRDSYNVAKNALDASSSGAEFATADRFDFLSNGFKLKASAAGPNISGGTYIFAAFAENPFKNSLAR